MRVRKTRRGIQNAFLQLRARKPVERITVKELSELAEISKATFYLHYKDMFDLSDQLQHEVMRDMIDEIVRSGVSVFDTVPFSRRLYEAFHTRQVMIHTLFSGRQSSILPLKIEEGIREYTLRSHPELSGSVRFHVLLSYEVHGTYQAYMENSGRFGEEAVLQSLEEIASHIKLIGY